VQNRFAKAKNLMKTYTGRTIGYFYDHIRRYKGALVLALAGLLVAISADMGLPLVMKGFVNLLAGGPSAPGAVAEISKLFAAFVFLSMISWIGWRIGSTFHALLEVRVMKDLSESCFAALHRQSFQFFNDQFVGALVKRVTRMVYAFEEIGDKVFYEFLPLVLRTAVVICVLWMMDAKFGILVLGWVILYIGFTVAISRYKMRNYDLPKAAADTAVTARLADTVSNHTTIRFFARFLFEKDAFSGVVEKWRKMQWSTWRFDLIIDSFTTALMIGLDAGILYYAILAWRDGSFTPGDLVLLQSYLMTLYQQLFGFGRTLRHFYELFANANEMMEIVDKKPAVRDRSGASDLKVTRGSVEAKGVSFSYTGEEEREVIRGLSFKVKAGEKVAFVGPSGGGKTTIFKLLLRLFDLQHGRILIDGQDIAGVRQDSLRAQIAMVPQEPVLFHRSLMENIRYGRPSATDEEVRAAAKLAHCHEFISGFPEKYGTFVGERGVKLSGGERQRVAIARAILADTRILVLDEATSSLDSESEKLIKDALVNLMRGKTVFVIAHRLSTVMDMDRIFVLEKGRIVEEGSHAELTGGDVDAGVRGGAHGAGLYKKLWEMQAGGYLGE